MRKVVQREMGVLVELLSAAERGRLTTSCIHCGAQLTVANIRTACGSREQPHVWTSRTRETSRDR